MITPILFLFVVIYMFVRNQWVYVQQGKYINYVFHYSMTHISREHEKNTKLIDEGKAHEVDLSYYKEHEINFDEIYTDYYKMFFTFWDWNGDNFFIDSPKLDREIWDEVTKLSKKDLDSRRNLYK